MLRKVRATIRLAPQLKTVAIEIALPRIWAGNISLRSNHDTENVSFYFWRGSARSCCGTLCTKLPMITEWCENSFFPAIKAHSYQPKATLIPTVSEKTYNLIKTIRNQCRRLFVKQTLSFCDFCKNFPTTRQLTTLLYIEPRREQTSKLTHKIEKSQSNDKVCAPVEDGGDGDGATTNVRRIELTEHQPCDYNTE